MKKQTINQSVKARRVNAKKVINKGKRREREFARLMTEAGYPAFRAAQYNGALMPDVECPTLRHILFEVKARRTPPDHATRKGWIKKVQQDAVALKRQFGVIALKVDRKPWLFIYPCGSDGEYYMASIETVSIHDLIKSLRFLNNLA